MGGGDSTILPSYNQQVNTVVINIILLSVTPTPSVTSNSE